jgi:hypothetical protein
MNLKTGREELGFLGGFSRLGLYYWLHKSQFLGLIIFGTRFTIFIDCQQELIMSGGGVYGRLREQYGQATVSAD